MKATTFLKPAATGILLSLLIVGCSQSDQSSLTGSASSAETALTKATGATSQNSTMRVQARLRSIIAGNPAHGHARWEQRTSRTKFSTELEVMTANGLHEVKVNGTSVGLVIVNLGFGEMNIDSRRHTVPTLQAGDLVEVFNPDGALVLSGTVGLALSDD